MFSLMGMNGVKVESINEALLESGASAAIYSQVNPYAAGGLFSLNKIMHKTSKIPETLSNGYSFESTQRELSNEYQNDRV